MVNTKSLPPALVVAGEIDVIDGAAGQRQDTLRASAMTSTHKTHDFAAVAIAIPRWSTGPDEPGDGKRTVI